MTRPGAAQAKTGLEWGTLGFGDWVGHPLAMNNITIIAAGLCGLALTVWAVLRHRRAELSRYPLCWKGWIIRFGLMGAGGALLCIPEEHVWIVFSGVAMIVLPLLFRQIPYEIATRLFPARSGRADK
jgi:hypothetical protein